MVDGGGGFLSWAWPLRYDRRQPRWRSVEGERLEGLTMGVEKMDAFFITFMILDMGIILIYLLSRCRFSSKKIEDLIGFLRVE